MEKLQFLPAIAVVAAFAASSAQGAQCEGVGVRTYPEPVIIHKAEDGTTTMLLRSTGTTTITSPTEMTGGASWQHCVGLWTVNPDKSGSGSGNCYSVDAEGDHWTISWEGDNAGGTWAFVNGTGKYAGRSDNKGTWKPGARFAGNMRLTLWDGTCGD